MESVIFWLRRDLRFADNSALIHASRSGHQVLPVFIFDQNIVNELKKDDPRISFIYSQLKSLNDRLSQYGSGIKIMVAKPVEAFRQLISSYNIKAVFANKEYEPYAIQRDLEVQQLLSESGIALFLFKDQVIFEEHEIQKADSRPYTVFTPYKNKWIEHFNKLKIIDTDFIDYNCFAPSSEEFPSIKQLGFVYSNVKVKAYQLLVIDQYTQFRDFPALDRTSYLGPHLRFGTVSIRQIIKQISSYDSTFLNELIWREFFMQILFHFPHIVNQNFKSAYNGIKWQNDVHQFERWCNGTTGYPLVDAGMRELNTTGYMHNRVRMVVASFLCKHLLIDWRWGEAYFAEKLLDYELSSNNGNWQWAAGTGCDAAPYFRVFNPSEQQKKFDPNLEYILKWIPEFGTVAYAKPMVDHKMARERAIKVYSEGIVRK